MKYKTKKKVDKNKITFIIPTINRPSLVTTLKSLQNLKNRNWNAIVIFDGIDIVKPVVDKRIKYIKVTKIGISNHSAFVRNKGIKLVKTKWTAFVDDDDTVRDNYIDIFNKELKTYPESDVIIFRMKYSDSGHIVPQIDLEDFVENDVGISFCLKTSLFHKEKYWFEPSSTEDFNLLDRLRKDGKKIYMSKEILYDIRPIAPNPAPIPFIEEKSKKTRKTKKRSYKYNKKSKTYKQKCKKLQQGGDNTAYVINLDSRTDRMEKIISRFPSLNMERISAIKHEDGWKGCGLSHTKTIRKAKEMGLPSILIMEDDAVPTETFSNWSKIKQWLDNNSEQWDIYLGGNTYYNMYTGVIDIEPICNIDSSIKLYKTKGLTLHFYYLNSSAYDSFLEWENNKDTPIDLWPNTKNMRIISSVPFIAVQDSSYSNIEKRNINYYDYYKNSEAFIGKVENNKSCE